MIRVESEMIKVKKSQPIFSCDTCVATNCIILIGNPNNQNYIKGRCCIFKEFGHYCLHSWRIIKIFKIESKKTRILFSSKSPIIRYIRDYLPTRARITVNRGAAGNDIFVLNSNICRSSTMNTNIWCCEYLSNMDIETVWK